MKKLNDASVEEEGTSMVMRQQGTRTKEEQTMEQRGNTAEAPKNHFFNPEGSTMYPRALIPLVFKDRTQAHILSSCSKALSEGRFRWRHDQVLKPIVKTISKRVQGQSVHPHNSQSHPFVKEGQRPENTKEPL